MNWAQLTTTLCVAALLTACASVDKGQRVVGQKATDMSSVAAAFDAESERVEALISRAGARITDPALSGYVQTIADKSAGKFQGEVRTYILQAPVFNAFMMPNGAMGVNTGLLLRAETEDELALVLGHEFGHYFENHSLERHAKVSNTNTLLKTASLAAAGAYAATGTYVNTTLASPAIIAGYFSFSRAHETEADSIGLEQVKSLGYDVSSAVRLWENLENEKRSSSLRAIRKRHSSIYDTHPTNEARIKALKTAAGITGETVRPSVNSRSAYRQRIRPFLQTWLEDEIALRDAGATLNLLDRLDDLGEDKGTLLYARARVVDRALSNKKLRKDKRTKELVADFTPDTVIDLLSQSTQEPDVPAKAFRDLGNGLVKAGRTDEANTAFKSYLRLSPNAPDAQLVKSLISE